MFTLLSSQFGNETVFNVGHTLPNNKLMTSSSSINTININLYPVINMENFEQKC